MPNHIPNIEALHHKLVNAYLTEVSIRSMYKEIRKSSIQHVQKGQKDFESLIKNNSMKNPKQLKDLLAEQISKLSSITTILEEVNLSQHYQKIKKISLALQKESDELDKVIDENSREYLSIQEKLIRYITSMDDLGSDDFVLAFIATFSNDMGFDLKKIFQSKTIETANLNIFKKELTTWTQEEWIALWKDDLCQFSTEKLKSTLEGKDTLKEYIICEANRRETEEKYFNSLTPQIKQAIKELNSLIGLITLISNTPSCQKVLNKLKKLKTDLDTASQSNVGDLDNLVTNLNQWVINVNSFKSNYQDNFISLGKDCYGAATKKEAETQTNLTESKEKATQTDFFINDLSKYHNLVKDLDMYSKTLSTQSSLGQNKSRSLMKIINACKVDNNLLSREQITNIQTVIQEEKKVLNQHRHHSLFNCFFSLFKATTLYNRVTSLKKVNELDNYLQQILESTHSQKLQIG